jgi:putative glutamine amidotransferase
MKKPIILIMWGSCLDTKFYAHSNMLTKAYSAAITAAGGIPILPLVESQVEEYAAMADGLVLPGAMGFVPRPELARAFALERYSRQAKFETELYIAFRKTGKPILGICAGCQKINCEEGGTLHLDFRKMFGIEHHQGVTHHAKATPGTWIADLWGTDFWVNSYHGFKIAKLGKGLRITAYSEEGIPEVIEHENHRIFGTQFHPERMRGDFPNPPEGPNSNPLFKLFVQTCQP